MSKNLFGGSAIGPQTLTTGACVCTVVSHEIVTRKKGVHHAEFVLNVDGTQRALGVTLFPEEGEDVKTAQGFKSVNNLIWAQKNSVTVALGHYLFAGNSRIRVASEGDFESVQEWASKNISSQREYASRKSATLNTGRASASTQGSKSNTPVPSGLPPEGDDSVF